MVTIQIQKRHMYFFSLVVGIVLGILVVNAYNSSPADPTKFGHSTDEIDWSKSIASTVTMSKRLTVGPMTSAATFPNSNFIETSGPFGGLLLLDRTLSSWPSSTPPAGNRFMLYNYGGIAHIWTDNSADVFSIDNNGDINATGEMRVGVNKMYASHDCTIVVSVAATGQGSVAVPDICKDNECLLVLWDNVGNVLSAGYYRQSHYTNGNSGGAPFDITPWSMRGAAHLGGAATPDATPSFGFNGMDQEEILGWTGSGYYVHLFDDSGAEMNPDSWFYQSVSNGFKLVACK